MEIKLLRAQKEFVMSQAKYPAIIGGLGCLRASTKIHTREGLKCISEIKPQDEVLSWNESSQKFQLAPTSGAYLKGMDYLYRVVTNNGEYFASEYHQILCADGKYRQVRHLKEGDVIRMFSPSPELALHGFDRVWSPKDDLWYWETASHECNDLSSPYDQQIHKALEACRVSRSIQSKQEQTSYILANTSITSITRNDVKEDFYDMHVAGNHNYVSEDGTIHHNSAKTTGGVYRIILLMLQHKCNCAYYMPVNSLIKLRAFPAFEQVLKQMSVPFTSRLAPDMLINVIGYGTIYFKSYDNPENIIAYEVGHSLVDELDTLKKDKAEYVWRKVSERNRQLIFVNGIPQKNTIGCVTTPDQGRNGFVYDRWVANKTDDHHLIKASTLDNIYLPDDYVEQITANYDPLLASLYVNGEFVNLNQDKVYHFYDETLNSDRTLQPTDSVHVGVDFNIGGCCIVLCVNDGGIIHVVEEMTANNTHDVIVKLQAIDNEKIVYPDAAGGYRKTNAAQTDIDLLEEAGLYVDGNKRNPVVRDRINCVNSMMSKGNLRVNVDKCPRLHEALVNLGYQKNGEPEKFIEHPSIDDWCDALGYYISKIQPIGRHIFKGIGY